MAKILITGASGFIGYHLVKRLSESHHDVYCLVRPTSSLERLIPFGVRFLYGDLNDLKSLGSVLGHFDTVFHLAGKVRAKNAGDFLTSNLGVTKNLVQTLLKSETPPVFIDVSSLAAVGPSRRGKFKTEKDVPAPISGYGKSKLAGERFLASVSCQMPCTIVRPGVVFGEGDAMNLHFFRTIAHFGFCPIPGWRDKRYSWIHADDLVELLLLAAQHGERLTSESLTSESEAIGTGIYFGSAYDELRLSEIGQNVGKALERSRIWTFRCPPVGVWIVSTCYEILKRTTGKDQPFDWAKAYEVSHHWTCSSEKATENLGFHVEKSFFERIQQTIQWYFDQGWIQGKHSFSSDAPPY